MEEIIKIYKKGDKTHHFCILCGDVEQNKKEMLSFFGQENNKQKFFVSIFEFDRLLIDDARDIISKAFFKAPQGQQNIFCICFNNINKESQNALLKSIEEPIDNTTIFFVVPRTDFLLPTVLSRGIVYNSGPKNNKILDKESIKKIIAKNIVERIKWANDIAKKIKDEKLQKSDARKIINEIILFLELEMIAEKQQNKKVKYSKSLKKLKKIDDYLNDSGASIKILLEKAVLEL